MTDNGEKLPGRRQCGRIAEGVFTMKNTVPPRALRGQGLTGAAPPMPHEYLKRGGCGRHAPPQKVYNRRAVDAWLQGANLATDGARGNPCRHAAQTQGGSRKKKGR